MENVNNEQALLSVLLLVLTSLATVSGSMPTVQSIETYFDAHAPREKEHFEAHKKEHFGAHKKEHFSNCGTREEEFKGRNEKFTSQHAHKNDLLEGFQGNMFAKF